MVDDWFIPLVFPDEDYILEEDEEKVYQMDARFDEWKRTACEHEEIELAYEYLSNISGMGAFRQIVSELGGKRKFPFLTEYLPTANGGILPNEYAQQALDELLLLEKEQNTEEKVILTEKSTGSLKASVSSHTYWFFVFTEYNKNTYGIDKEGFFILENVKEKGKEVSYIMFRSINFIQQSVSKDLYRFIDIPSGESYECSVKLHPNEDDATDDYGFEVKTQPVGIANEYEYIIEPLKRLATASIKSGNPIHWT